MTGQQKKATILTYLKKGFDRSSPLFGTRLLLIFALMISVLFFLTGLNQNLRIAQFFGIIFFIKLMEFALFHSALNHHIRQPESTFDNGFGKYESLSRLIKLIVYSILLIPAVILIINPIYHDVKINLVYLLVICFIGFLGLNRLAYLQNRTAVKFKLNLLSYNSGKIRRDSEIFFILPVLFLGIFIIKENINNEIAAQIDNFASMGLMLLYLYKPIIKAKSSFNNLLDKTVPESLQFDILATVAENFDKICEYKRVIISRTGSAAFVTIEVILPYDFTLEEKYNLEKELKRKLRETYKSIIFRIYALPCDKGCTDPEQYNCPIRARRKGKSSAG